jgi:glycerol-3-phosphate dehydrogenase
VILQRTGEELSGEQLHEILKEIDTNMNGQVELDEYLQVCNFISTKYFEISKNKKNMCVFFKILEMNGVTFLCILQMMSAIKSGAVTYSRFATIAEIEEEHVEREKLKKNITVDRSGGGF